MKSPSRGGLKSAFSTKRRVWTGVIAAVVLAAAAGTVASAANSSSSSTSATTASSSYPTAIPTKASALSLTWPTATGTTNLTATKTVSSYDGGMKRVQGWGGSQDEDQDPLFIVKDGGTIQNVIIGNKAGDGIHCEGTCLIKNVWWEDVGEDAATQKGKVSGQVMQIDGGGAKKADDKVFQQNGPGKLVVQNFVIQDFGKLYRSCGNCSTQYQRSAEFYNVIVVDPGKSLAGINTNYKDTATFKWIRLYDDDKSISICDKYTGNSSGKEPTKTGSGADGTYCKYSSSDITYK
ncbi:pectate lyase [Kineosporia sp. J2-2]|uniref:Pectate lyase n=1 Tax=Kineosporia corallincola TaxID=2835133 RepID=A0ABS5TEN8_9ACTN|nr:pectate lyase [Kineosporia corallincola]MBT0769549.1 pectate lyase [Kineosporia corallincola]